MGSSYWEIINIIPQYLNLHKIVELKKDAMFKYICRGKNIINKLILESDWRKWNYSLYDLVQTYEDEPKYRYYIKLAINKILIKGLRTNLTHEQKKIEQLKVKNNKWYPIQAYAGTGKTTTLYNFSKANLDKHILYLAFNKGLEIEARRGRIGNLPNVKCYTIHSYILEELDRMGHVDKNNVINEYKCLEIKKHFRNFSFGRIRSMIHDINRFFQSDNTHPRKAEVQKLWDFIRCGKIPYTHDAYIKLYEILQIKMEFDVILLDEAQDSTICMLSILKKSKAAKLLVGDGYQQIYGFRGSVNPFALIKEDAEQTFHLSHTFRFGNEICEFVNMYMSEFLEGYNVGVNTYNTYDSKINIEKSEWFKIEAPTKKACLFFSNKGLYEFAFRCVMNSQPVHIIGNDLDFYKEAFIVRDFIRIENGEEPFIEELKDLNAGLTSIEMYFATIGDKEWCWRIMMYRSYGSQLTVYYDLLNEYNKESANIILSTIHKSKGLEFDHVLLGDDFPTITTGLKESTVNCIYVALTRARKTLTLNKSCKEWYRTRMKFYKYGRKNTCRICGNLTTLMENDIPTCTECVSI